MKRNRLSGNPYDTDAIIEQVTAQEMEVVIPAKKNRLVQRRYDRDLYKLRQRARKCVSNPQAMARHCYTLHQKLLLPRDRPNPMHYCGGLKSCDDTLLIVADGSGVEIGEDR